MAHDVFISYSSKDRPWADGVTATLEANGVRCWMAPRDIPEGTEYPAALAAALRASRAVVLIFSADSNESPQVQREIERAVALKIPVLPLRLENVPLSQGMEYLISTPQWLDVDPVSPEQGVARLVPAVQKLLAAPPLALRDVVVPKLPKLIHAHRRVRQLQAALAAGIALLAVAAGAYWYTTRTDSVIVMPVRNGSGNADLDRYRVAFPLDIIAALRNLPDRFIPKPQDSTLIDWAASGMSPAEASRAFRTDKVLTASFERSGDTLAFRAQLIVPATESVKWSYPSPDDRKSAEQCLRDPSNPSRLLPLRRVILEGILDNLNPPPPAEARSKVLDPPTNSCDAYDRYVEARAEWNRRSASGFRRAIALYREAIEIDENFALAYAGLADCFNLLADYSIVRPTDEKEGFPAALASADRALALGAKTAEAHVAKAFYLYQYQWDWLAAEREFAAANSINSNYATGLQWRAVYYSAMGRHDEAIAQIDRAMTYDDRSPILATNRGWLLRLARRSSEAERTLLDVLARTPEFEEAHRQLGDVYLDAKDYTRALAEYTAANVQALAHDMRERTEYQALIARASAYLGQRERALMAAQQFERQYSSEYFPASYIALIYIALGDHDAAFKWLTQSVDDKSDEVILLNVDSAYDSLRGDARFVELVKRVGLP